MESARKYNANITKHPLLLKLDHKWPKILQEEYDDLAFRFSIVDVSLRLKMLNFLLFSLYTFLI